MARRRIRVLLADDHSATRKGLVRILGDIPDIEIAGEAVDGYEAVKLAKELLPDVVIMDVAMPELNGIEATRIIRSELPKVNVLGLSLCDEAAQEMRHAGAADFFNKIAPWKSIVEAIRNCDAVDAKQE
jgi:DNA-binding NarL/FixJ family response regulator